MVTRLKIPRFILLVLSRAYGAELSKHNYSTALSSVTFAGTVAGMLIFGYLTDKIGRKTGMVRYLLFG